MLVSRFCDQNREYSASEIVTPEQAEGADVIADLDTRADIQILLDVEQGFAVQAGVTAVDVLVEGAAGQLQAVGGAVAHASAQVDTGIGGAAATRLGAYLHDVAGGDEIEAILQRFPRLRDRIDSPAGLLSGGEQQMVAVGRGLMARPKILLLDEPSLGLSPSMIGELYDALAALRDEGVTLLLVDQMANLALQVADRAYVLETGHVIKSGSAAQLREDTELAAAYLGEGVTA